MLAIINSLTSTSGPTSPALLKIFPVAARIIVIPTLVPNEQTAISYLYHPPLIADQVNAGIKCDQGFAKAIPVLITRQATKEAAVKEAADLFEMVLKEPGERGH